ncbi:hypothetical protein O181_021142 [Austropuccinia psidii MF-1]|uniref:Uncharacterized protein n=1 Tax=Austropuccinia psidii MF-1 TaxID=1389203 RepID=A0A9Q3CEX5_9BASI|nr:hypothetical protein [Austropuccinia psidii MF-1]
MCRSLISDEIIVGCHGPITLILGVVAGQRSASSEAPDSDDSRDSSTIIEESSGSGLIGWISSTMPTSEVWVSSTTCATAFDSS